MSPWGSHGYATARGRFGGRDAWHLVRQPHLGARNLRPYLVNAGQVDTAGIRVADSVLLRPAADIDPSRAPSLIGRRAPRDIAAGSAFLAADLEPAIEGSASHVA